MYRGQFLTEYGVPSIKAVFTKSEYRVFTLIITARGEWGSGLSI